MSGKACGKSATGSIRTINGKAFQTILYWYEGDAPGTAVDYCTKHFRETAVGLIDTFMPKEKR
jgi:hypothetical protein